MQFNFIDVHGDGNCFYYALLKDSDVRERHLSHQGIREALVSKVQQESNDPFLQYIFQQNGKVVHMWSNSVIIPGTWGSNFEAMIYTYFFKKTIIIVEAIQFGITNSTYILELTYQNWSQKHCYPDQQFTFQMSEIPVYILFHQMNKPVDGTRLNHFAYLSPVYSSPSQRITDLYIVTPSPKKAKISQIHTLHTSNRRKICFEENSIMVERKTIQNKYRQKQAFRSQHKSCKQNEYQKKKIFENGKSFE